MRKATLPTNNEAWGFFGTVRHHADPHEAWPINHRTIEKATGCADDAGRDSSTVPRTMMQVGEARTPSLCSIECARCRATLIPSW